MTLTPAIRLLKLDLLRDGLAYFPKVLAPSDIEILGQIADFDYELIMQPNGDPDPISQLAAEVARSSAKWGGIPVDHFRTLGTKKSADIAQVLDRVLLRLTEALERSGNCRANFRPEISYVRRHYDVSTYAPWHFDAHAAGTINFDPAYNAWVPMTSVGETSPSLEFIAGTHKAMRSGNFDPLPDKNGYPTEDWVRRNTTSKNYICPFLQPGDVVIFDHYVLHRTQIADFPPYVRTSAEMRYTIIRNQRPSLIRSWLRSVVASRQKISA
jgi:hypothetical protein